jgi:hypothetical protein
MILLIIKQKEKKTPLAPGVLTVVVDAGVVV